MAELYQYKPLQNSRSIRLLELRPSTAIESHDKLIQVSVDNPPPYEALSYAWGSRLPFFYIFCEEKNLPVTQTCAAAVSRLRRTATSRLLWIDAICIDQSSIPERNIQVQLMGEIYQRATQVLIWLGENTHETQDVLEYLRKAAQLEHPKYAGRLASLSSQDRLLLDPAVVVRSLVGRKYPHMLPLPVRQSVALWQTGLGFMPERGSKLLRRVDISNPNYKYEDLNPWVDILVNHLKGM